MEDLYSTNLNSIFTNMDASYNAFKSGTETNSLGLINNITSSLVRTHVTGSQASYDSTKQDWFNGSYQTTYNHTIPTHTETAVDIINFDNQGITKKVIANGKAFCLLQSDGRTYKGKSIETYKVMPFGSHKHGGTTGIWHPTPNYYVIQDISDNYIYWTYRIAIFNCCTRSKTSN